MYKPDRVILRKIKEYCPHLFVEWNNRKKYFEVWISMPHGRRLVTPVTRSIYEEDCYSLTYTPLDERILWWLYVSDGYRHNNVKNALLESDRRYKEIELKAKKDSIDMYKTMGKDMWSTFRNFYPTKHTSKNSLPKFNTVSKGNKWIPPDIQKRTSPRLFSRSAANAKAYGFKRWI